MSAGRATCVCRFRRVAIVCVATAPARPGLNFPRVTMASEAGDVESRVLIRRAARLHIHSVP